jgi:colanic acid/amylovoran biosynthesis glycosyltransferase
MKVAYMVSRFPHVSETFIVRELNAVAAEPGVEVILCSLFAAVDTTVHEAARAWVPRLRRPSPLVAIRDLLAWTVRRPVRMASTVAEIARGYVGRPALLMRALATIPLAASHARELESCGVEHVHAHYATYPALAAWITQRLTGIGYSFTAHAHDIYVDRRFLGRKLADARYVVTISEYNRRLLEAEAGGRATPIHVVRCGIHPSRYRFRPRVPAEERPVKVLCVASLQQYKGHAILMNALAQGDPRLQRIELDLVGGGRLRPALERQAARAGLSRRVRFHGSLTEDQVTAFLETAPIFVMPSTVAQDGQMDGLPVALIEALACGLVVVSTRLSGIPELVEDGVTGFLAEPGDAESLAHALCRALGSDASRLDHGRARALIEREYDIERNARRLVGLLGGSASLAGRSV